MPDLSLADDPTPFALAVQRLDAKTPIGSILRSEHWEQVPLALRERAQFSAGIEQASVMQAVQDKLQEWVELSSNKSNRAFMDRSRFVAEMRQVMQSNGLDEGHGGITNPASKARLELIYNFQTTDAAEFGRWQMGQDPDVLDAFPAQEFLRVESRNQPRSDWSERWAAAGGRTYDGRWIALKSDPVWVGISRFGRPWPPFDFGSGMGVEDISRVEAERLGLLKKGQKAKPVKAQFNQSLQASVKNLAPSMQEALKTLFGSQIQIKDGTASWNHKNS